MYKVLSPIKFGGRVYRSGLVELPERIGADLVRSGHVEIHEGEPARQDSRPSEGGVPPSGAPQAQPQRESGTQSVAVGVEPATAGDNSGQADSNATGTPIEEPAVAQPGQADSNAAGTQEPAAHKHPAASGTQRLAPVAQQGATGHAQALAAAVAAAVPASAEAGAALGSQLRMPAKPAKNKKVK